MRQDKDIGAILMAIEVHSQDVYDKMVGPSRHKKITVSGTEARIAIATLGDSVMELAKTLSDINDKIDFLKQCDHTQAEALLTLLKDRKPPYYRRAYDQLRSILRYFIWRIPM